MIYKSGKKTWQLETTHSVHSKHSLLKAMIWNTFSPDMSPNNHHNEGTAVRVCEIWQWRFGQHINTRWGSDGSQRTFFGLFSLQSFLFHHQPRHLRWCQFLACRSLEVTDNKQCVKVTRGNNGHTDTHNNQCRHKPCKGGKALCWSWGRMNLPLACYSLLLSIKSTYINSTCYRCNLLL